MKNNIFLMVFLCLGLWISCSPDFPSDMQLSKMSTIEKWACLKKGMPQDKVFRILGTPQGVRASKRGIVYTFNCFLCTVTFDTLKELKCWHSPQKTTK